MAASAQQRPFTYEDLLLLDRMYGLDVDPNGDYAVFSVRATDMEQNKGVSSLWLKDLQQPDQPEVRLSVSDAGATDAHFSPDGGSIYFLSARGENGVTNLWRTDLAGAKAEQVTHLPLDVIAYQLAPDGAGVVVALAVFPDCRGDEITCTVKRQVSDRADPSSGTVYTRLFVRHWDTWADGTRNHLFYLPLEQVGAEPVALMDGFDGDVPSKPFGDAGDLSISPDGRTVFFSVRVAGDRGPWSTNFDIYSVPVTGGPATLLTVENDAWDAAPRMSPDGRLLAYKAMARPGFEADRFAIMLRDGNGNVRPLAADWDRSVDEMKWAADGKSLLVTAADMGRERLFRIDIENGQVTQLSADGHIDAFVGTPRGLVFMKSALNSPSLLYMAKPKARMIDDGAVPLTRVDAVVKDRAFGKYEQFHFKGWNNEDVHGYVIKPANYVDGRKYPVAFLIHGGPQGSFGDSWSYRWNPETYAGAGYAVVMIDFHGSMGYGQAFTDAISTHWGDRPLEDLRKGWDHVLRNYPFLDGDRAAALGASYGGFMVNWIAGNWKEPWKCLVSHDGVFDTRSMGYTTEEMWFEEWENGADVFTDPAAYDRFDPALHAKDWSVPMLVIHSDLDFRIPVEQGIAVFTALQAKGIPSQFLHFPDENHWVLRPQNSMKWHRTVFDWLDRYIGTGAGK